MYFMKKRCPLKSSVGLLATCEMCTGGTFKKKKSRLMQDGVFFFLFFYRAPFVYEDVHRAGGACHQGTIPCPL